MPSNPPQHVAAESPVQALVIGDDAAAVNLNAPPPTARPAEIKIIDQHASSPTGQPCPDCGATIERYDRYCPHCGRQARRDQELSGAAGLPEADVIEAQPTAPRTVPQDQHFLKCQQCSAEIATDADHRSYTCPFCDSTYVVDFSPQVTGRQDPEFIIGFVVTREQALERFRHWIRAKGWFRPGDLRMAKISGKIAGVYLPFWSFSMLANSNWSATIGEYWYRTETYTERDSNGKMVTRTRRVQETEWWPLAGRHHQYYSGYLVSGSRGLPQAQAERVMPFNLPALKRYQPYFLAGWQAEEYSVTRDEALQLSQAEFYRAEQQNVAWFLPGDTHRGLNVQTWFQDVNSDLCLLPFYILSYRYQERLYRFLVNGQTGAVAGDKPVSPGRIIAFIVGVIGLLLLGYLLVLLFNYLFQ